MFIAPPNCRPKTVTALPKSRIDPLLAVRNYETRRLIAAGSVLEHKFVPNVKGKRKAKAEPEKAVAKA